MRGIKAKRQRLAPMASQGNSNLYVSTLKKREAAVKKFLDYYLPEPGRGDGCHNGLLGAANLACKARVTRGQAFEYIRKRIPEGNRHVSDREIWDAVNKAYDEAGKETEKPYIRTKPAVRDGSAALRNIISQATVRDDVSIIKASPVRIDWPHEEDAIHFLETAFLPNDLVFIGDRLEPGILGRNIRTAVEWIAFFKKGGKAGPFFIVNPLSGNPALTRTGDKETYRGDLCVSSFRHCLVEFDNLSREDQLAFWSVIKLPVKALIDTGGKSIHGIIDVQKLANVQTAEDWQTHIKMRLYDQILIPLGVDGACKNPARLSRLPGVFRPGKGKMQRLLWLSHEGREVVR